MLGSTGRASAETPWAAIRRRPRARERAAASAVLDVSLIGRSWRQRSVSLVPLVHLVKDGLQVFLLHATASKLLGERTICHRGFAQDEDSRGFLVQAVKDGETIPPRFTML